MRVGVTHIITRRSGKKARRDETLDASPLTVGRGTDNSIALSDLAVGVKHAAFHERTDGVYVEALGTAEVRLNRRRTTGEAAIRPGDCVRIGPFELRVVEPAEGNALQLEIEQVEQRGSEREELESRTRAGVERGWLTRRKLSWIFVIGIFAGFAVVPLLTGEQGSWSSGSITRKHAFIADDCSKCHAGEFQTVRDEDCSACHSSIERHTHPQIQIAELEETRCATCHLEHNGDAGLAALDQSLCDGCHANLKDSHPATKLGDASDFLRDHPEFRLFFAASPAAEADFAVLEPGLEEHSGVKFSHLRHVGQEVAGADEDFLACDSCHELDAAAKNFEPVVFEEHCQSCHGLNFDPMWKKREAIHGNPLVLLADLEEAYSNRALKGEVQDPSAPRFTRFRRPGQKKFTPEEAEQSTAWVKKKLDEATRRLFVKDDKCALCHDVLATGASGETPELAPVRVSSIWMPKSEFTHGTHGPFPCRDCHPAAAVFDEDEATEEERPDWAMPTAKPFALYTKAEVKTIHGVDPSVESTDILIPGIDSCRICHGDATDDPPLVPSECVLCHPFHREEHGPM